MFRREIYFQTMSHIEYLVHFIPIGTTLFFDSTEQRRNREKVILNHTAVVAYEVQNFSLCTTRTVNHTVNLRTQCIEQFLHYRSICTGWRKYQLTGIQRRTFYSICQFQITAVNQILGHSLVVTFRIFFGQVFCEYIVTGTCQTVATHTAVIFFFVSSLSVRSQTYNHITRTDVCIVNYIGTFHTASYCTVHNDGTYQVANIGSLTTGSIYTYTHFTQFGQQFVCSVNDSRNDFARNQEFVTSDSR